MKKILYLLLFIAGSITAQAQDAEMADIMRSNGKIYVMGGIIDSTSGNATDTVLEFDPVASSWATKSPMIFASATHVAAGDGDMIVVFIQRSVATHAYSISANTWYSVTDAPNSYYGRGAAAVNGNYYLIGGQNLSSTGIWGNTNNFTGTTHELIIGALGSPDTWNPKADMPTGREYHSCATVNGNIYAVGGYNNTNFDLRTVEMFNPTFNVWSKKYGMFSNRETASAVSLNGKLYVIGGMHMSNVVNTVEEYDPAVDP